MVIRNFNKMFFFKIISWIVVLPLLLFVVTTVIFFSYISYEERLATQLKERVRAYIERGVDTIRISDVFNAEEKYDSICILTSRNESPIDYTAYTDRLLSNGQISSVQYRNMPDLFEYMNYPVVFVMLKGNDVRLLPFRRKGIYAKGKNEKKDFFVFYFDASSKDGTASEYGCHNFQRAVFKLYEDGVNNYHILLTAQ